jgi:Cu/Ag efflux protein CusF
MNILVQLLNIKTKNMKKIAITMAMVSLLTFAAQAQDATGAKTGAKTEKSKGTPEEWAKRGADNAEKKLTLTADQKTQWQSAALARITANHA